MAKRKAKTNPDDLEIRTIGVRTTKAWADWLERAARHSRMTVATFLDRAAAEHAKETGFDEAPPERLP
jgi:uncharacterized protein (DUF1778 family)